MAYTNTTAHETSTLHLHPQQYAPPPSSSPPPFFRHPGVPIDPSLEGSIQQHSRSLQSSPQLQVLGHPSLQAQHLQQTYYNGMGTPPPPPPAHTSPRFAHLSPRQRRHSTPAPYTPPDRQLPSKEDVTSEAKLEEAYIKFILYCNPAYPLDGDHTKLKELFNASPKSDGKSFSMWNLFDLIKKLEAKEIPSWIQLALDLGVEPPDVSKNQSTQKVQQWTVRLKRWMYASRMSAFFDYLLGKDNIFYTQIPAPHEPYPGEQRAGISLMEDLALRALDPQFRPKRGRRKAEDQEDDHDRGNTPDPKRPHLDPGTATTPYPHNDGFVHPGSSYPPSGYPQSAVPMSAHPDGYDPDPWTAASVANPNPFAQGYSKSPLRWAPGDTPATAHPMSGISRLSPNLDAVMEEPQSAVTPSTSKRKRRHGPAVSSAWPSTGSSTGKLRGRPPSNRTVKDGPFVTFPAQPNQRETTPNDRAEAEPSSAHPSRIPPQHATNTLTGLATPMTAPPHTAAGASSFQFPSQATSAAVAAKAAAATAASATSETGSLPFSPSRPTPKRQSTAPTRGERLSLQVPARVGGPVHLITPTLTVQSPSEPGSAISPRTRMRGPMHYPTPVTSARLDSIKEHQAGLRPTSAPAEAVSHATIPMPNFPAAAAAQASTATTPAPVSAGPSPSATGYESLKRALVVDLVRAELIGRKQRLRGIEAKSLAEVLLHKLRSSISTPTDPSAAANTEQEAHVRATCAAWLGIAPSASVLPVSSGSGKKITVQRFRTSEEGYDSPIDESEEVGSEDKVTEIFEVAWTLQMGACRADFVIKELVIDQENKDGRGEGEAGGKQREGLKAEDVDWEEKYKRARRELEEMRERVLGVVVD